MKVLQICQKPPFPPVDGGAIAMNNVTQGLLNLGHQVKVICVETPKHPSKRKDLPTDYVQKTQFESVFIDTSIKLKAAFFNLFSKRSYNIERFICLELEEKIEDTLANDNYDVVILEGLFVAPNYSAIRRSFRGKIVLRAHNIEFRIWERMAENARNPFKKMYLNFLSKRLQAFEIKSFNRMDGICAMTDLDLADIQRICPDVPAVSIPSGYILQHKKATEEEIEPQAIFHIASMDWQPNIQALDWFLEHAWTGIKAANPNCKLYLAGRKMPEHYFSLNDPQIITVGEVESAAAFYQGKSIMIVPLLSGSGMRIKIIEGMAMGKAIVSTSIGAEGIECEDGKHLLIADSADKFVEKVNYLLQNPTFRGEISRNAGDLIKNRYDNDVICDKMIRFIASI